MSVFEALGATCSEFDRYLERVISDLHCARVGDNIEDDIVKKMRDISLLTAKSRLVQANITALTPEITEQEKDENKILTSYGETATLKVKEQQVVAMFTRAHAVRKLITTPDKRLEPEQLERKAKIIDQLNEFRNKETELRLVDSLLAEKEAERETVREKWFTAHGKLRDQHALRPSQVIEDDDIPTGPLYDKLRSLVGKMETMRLLIAQLVTARAGDYDWLSDPHKRLVSLKIAREPNTVEDYLEG